MAKGNDFSQVGEHFDGGGVILGVVVICLAPCLGSLPSTRLIPVRGK
jgi:hypothetical protein